MNPTISAKSVSTHIIIPGSKAMTYRAIFLAALADGVTELRNVFIHDEVIMFVNALRDLGLMIQLDKSTHTCIVGGGGGKVPRAQGAVFLENSKTVAILLLAICATSNGIYDYQTVENFKPFIDAFNNALTRLGTRITATQIEGQDGLKGGEVELPHDDSGILISALLMIAPFAKKAILIKTDDSISQPLIEMTCELMGDFNVLVRRMHRGRYSVPVPQRYLARDFIIEPDLLIAAYFFAGAALLGTSLTIQPVQRSTAKQIEVEFLNVLEKMGCVITENNNGLTLQGPLELTGVNVDTRHFPQAFMALAALAPFAKTPTTITNIDKTHTKDGSRISLMRKELEKLKVCVEEGKDWLKIHPSIITPAILDTHDDPYLAMALMIFQLRFPHIQINGVNCIEKVCPHFLHLWELLRNEKKLQGH